MIDILLLGKPAIIEEIRPKLQSMAIGQLVINEVTKLTDFQLIIDTHNHIPKERLLMYFGLKNVVVMIGAVTSSLQELVSQYTLPIQCHLLGLNALPTFLQRSLWEISLFNKHSQLTAEQILHKIGIEYRWVADRVGMVTPRIIAMIINEACYTLQEQTATIKAIDKAMKLGTRYPYGPFEWADKIGIQQVYQILASLYEDTKDERYKVCSLLKSKYLRNETFYQNKK